MKEIKEQIKNLTKSVDKIDKVVDKIEENMHLIDKTLVKQEENLKLHMHRTEVSENRLAHVETVLVPINKHVNMVHGAMKLLGIVAILVGIAATISRLL